MAALPAISLMQAAAAAAAAAAAMETTSVVTMTASARMRQHLQHIITPSAS
jgi:hypothetical protein